MLQPALYKIFERTVAQPYDSYLILLLLWIFALSLLGANIDHTEVKDDDEDIFFEPFIL